MFDTFAHFLPWDMGIQRSCEEQGHTPNGSTTQCQMQAVAVGAGERLCASAEVVADIEADGDGGNRCKAP